MKKKDYSDCPVFLRNYLMYLTTILGRSARTVEGYYFDLRLFLRFLFCREKNLSLSCINEISIEDIPLILVEKASLDSIYEFLHYTTRERQNGADARGRKASAIRRFYRYLTQKAMLFEENPAKELEVPNSKKKLPKYLTLEQSHDLLKAAAKGQERDFCMIVLFLNCGMRLSELVGINLRDIRISEKEATLRLIGKGNKERIVYLNDACTTAISEYMKVRAKDLEYIKDKEALFLNRRGGRISGRRIEQIVERLLNEAGFGGMGLSPHKLRHTAATMLYQHAGVDILVLKSLLGHVGVGTTEIYTHLSDKELKKAAESSPFAEVSKNSDSSNDE